MIVWEKEMRKAFEEIMLKKGMDSTRHDLYENEYRETYVQSLWEIWIDATEFERKAFTTAQT
jgi:hypothetical protein